MSKVCKTFTCWVFLHNFAADSPELNWDSLDSLAVQFSISNNLSNSSSVTRLEVVTINHYCLRFEGGIQWRYFCARYQHLSVLCRTIVRNKKDIISVPHNLLSLLTQPIMLSIYLLNTKPVVCPLVCSLSASSKRNPIQFWLKFHFLSCHQLSLSFHTESDFCSIYIYFDKLTDYPFFAPSRS